MPRGAPGKDNKPGKGKQGKDSTCKSVRLAQPEMQFAAVAIKWPTEDQKGLILTI